MKLAFCIALKNRSYLEVEYEDSTPFLKHAEGKIVDSPYPPHPMRTKEDRIVLTLLPHMLTSLVKIKKPEDDWVVIVSDFGSTDVEVHRMMDEILSQGEGIDWYLYREKEWPYFDRGGGLKKAAEIAETKYNADAVFFLDADLIFYSRQFIDECYNALSKGLFYYPIFFAFADPKHERGFWRDTSYGNFAARIEDYKKTAGWKHNISWGWEDRDLDDSIPTDKKYRIEMPGFCHQWHPMKWDFRVSEYPVKQYLFKDAAVAELPKLSGGK
jgi:glycosyltransferase involved in cell wall biosynthesis